MSWYSAAWEQPVEAPACMPMTTIPETGTLPDSVVPCPAPTPPVGVPTAAEAEERARQLLVALGVDLGAVQFDARSDELFASVEVAQHLLDAGSCPARWSFVFGPDGVLKYANGMLASPEPVGPYPLLDVDAAFARLQEQQAGAGWVADMLPLQAVPPPAGTTGTIASRTAAACAGYLRSYHGRAGGPAHELPARDRAAANHAARRRDAGSTADRLAGSGRTCRSSDTAARRSRPAPTDPHRSIRSSGTSRTAAWSAAPLRRHPERASEKALESGMQASSMCCAGRWRAALPNAASAPARRRPCR